jgi:menaquinone-specific isochorismate synthase
MTPAATTVLAAVDGLVARTVGLDHPPDLLAIGGRRGGVVWQNPGGGLAGVGVAARIPLPGGLAAASTVSRALSAVATDDEVGEPGCGPVAIGALPFLPSATGELVIPEIIVGRSGSRAWLTTVSATTSPPADAAELAVKLQSGGPGGDPPDDFTLRPALPHQRWKQLVADAVAAIATRRLAKVVLARRIDIGGNRPFVVGDVLSRLAALYPSCMLFQVDGFLGASPELLVERRGAEVRSFPLAGTVARSGDVASDHRLIADLLASPKERSEHRFVVDALVDALGPVCSSLHVPDQPEVLGLRNVSHLATPITGRLRLACDHGDLPTALELAARVHPTPAVAGTPTAEALRYLSQVEGFDRGRFAGPVGWVDARGDGKWALGIRSAAVSGAHASIFAGVGIVADSDPAAELAETQLKLQALLAALVRP